MKVYEVHYTVFEQTSIVGVFTTREKANIWIDEIVERDKGLYSEESIRSHYTITETDCNLLED